jgi:hypothetical protein
MTDHDLAPRSDNEAATEIRLEYYRTAREYAIHDGRVYWNRFIAIAAMNCLLLAALVYPSSLWYARLAIAAYGIALSLFLRLSMARSRSFHDAWFDTMKRLESELLSPGALTEVMHATYQQKPGNPKNVLARFSITRLAGFVPAVTALLWIVIVICEIVRMVRTTGAT